MNLDEFAAFIRPIYNPWGLKGANYEFARYLMGCKRFDFDSGAYATYDTETGEFDYYPADAEVFTPAQEMLIWSASLPPVHVQDGNRVRVGRMQQRYDNFSVVFWPRLGTNTRVRTRDLIGA